MRIILFVFCILSSLVSAAKGDVVGISPTTDIVANAVASTQGFSFQTTSLTGSQMSGIGLWGKVAQGASTGIVISLSDGVVTKTGSFNVLSTTTTNSENAITWDSGYTGLLAASKTYSVILSNFTVGDFRSIQGNGYSTGPGISAFWTNPTSAHTTDLGVSLFYDSTSVPEPTTMVLTGAALAFGFGASFIRRFRKKQEKVLVS